MKKLSGILHGHHHQQQDTTFGQNQAFDSNLGTSTSTLGTSQPLSRAVPTDTLIDTSNVPYQSSITGERLVLPTERIERPAVFHEKLHAEQVEEIQPVIHREHQTTEVHQILQPMQQTLVQQPQYLQKELPVEIRETVAKGPTYVPAPVMPGSTEFVGTERMTIMKQPIIMETEKRQIIEEVQPVVYKEVIQPTIIKETQNIFEKVVEPAYYMKEVLPTQVVTAPVVEQSFAQTGYTTGYAPHQYTSAIPQKQFGSQLPSSAIPIAETFTIKQTHTEIPRK
jgi:hypothetical protein